MIVSIADAFMVGIRMLVKGVEQVFKAIVKVIDDIASPIGSFLKMLAKFIEDVIAALSVLFHFGRIMAVQRVLVSDILAQADALQAAIAQTVKPAVNGFFSTVENATVATFNRIRGQLNGRPVNSLPGSGATAHTAFSAGQGSAGPGSGGSSHAVHCGWGTQKAMSGLPSATSSGGGSSDPFVGAVQDFVGRITGDGDLSGAFSQLQNGFSNLFRAHSAAEFFSSALDVLLNIIEALVLGLVAVGGAFMDALLDIVAGTIGVLMDLIEADLISRC